MKLAEEQADDGRALLSLQCYGEGEEWQSQAKVGHLGNGGLSLEIEGFSQIYLPCGTAP